MTTKQSITWTAFWIFAALLFSGYVYHEAGMTGALQYLTVFTLEKLLSLDNLFVMFTIFGFFKIPPEQQRKALLLGIIGAFVFRTAIILSGTFIVAKLAGLLYFFAGFLVYAGGKMIFGSDDEYNPQDSAIVRGARSLGNFGVFWSCVAAIELSDIAFAADSIPASFGVSQDPFIILPANLFAVMGLRSLYHAVANGLSVLQGIEKYIGAVLALVGASVFIKKFWFDIPELYLMAAVFCILTIGIIACKKKGDINVQNVA